MNHPSRSTLAILALTAAISASGCASTSPQPGNGTVAICYTEGTQMRCTRETAQALTAELELQQDFDDMVDYDNYDD